jgi:hypothetical protein
MGHREVTPRSTEVAVAGLASYPDCNANMSKGFRLRDVVSGAVWAHAVLPCWASPKPDPRRVRLGRRLRSEPHRRGPPHQQPTIDHNDIHRPTAAGHGPFRGRQRAGPHRPAWRHRHRCPAQYLLVHRINLSVGSTPIAGNDRRRSPVAPLRARPGLRHRQRPLRGRFDRQDSTRRPAHRLRRGESVRARSEELARDHHRLPLNAHPGHVHPA